MYHMHVGLSTWEATEAALVEVVRRRWPMPGHTVDRFGLALDRAMGIPEAERHLAVKETGPRIGPDEWQRLGEAAPIQPHLGDYMIGFPAGFQNTLRALAAGVTTIGNVGQYTAYDLLGGSDEILVTEETVRALAAIGALRATRRARSLEPRGRLGHAGLALRRVRRMGGARAVRRRGAHRRPAGALLRQHDPEPRVPRRRALRARRSPRSRLDRLDDLRQHGRSPPRRPGPQHRRLSPNS